MPKRGHELRLRGTPWAGLHITYVLAITSNDIHPGTRIHRATPGLQSAGDTRLGSKRNANTEWMIRWWLEAVSNHPLTTCQRTEDRDMLRDPGGSGQQETKFV